MGAWKLLPVGAAALLLAACGSGGGSNSASTSGSTSASPQRAVADALAKTEATSSHVFVTVQVYNGRHAVTQYGEHGSLDRSGGDLFIDRRQTGGALIHEIFQRGDGKLDLYLNPSPAPLAKGKKWLKIDLIRYGKERYGAETTAFVSADREPLQPARLLGSSVAHVTLVGPDFVGPNIPTTHYRGHVNVVAAGRAAGVKGAGLRTLTSDMGKVTQTIDVWVDKQGLIEQLIVSSPQPTAGKGVTLRETVQLQDFGKGGAVKAPPASVTQSFYKAP
ncbi:MAG: hypothetical protein JO073_11585 [Actinobacteria bacterium]|nr:hypothetical protein [Actinomycetota bacterium]